MKRGYTLRTSMIVVDVQTTGWDARKDHIIEVGAVDFTDPARTFHRECRLSPNASISSEALRAFQFERQTLIDTERPTVRSAIYDFIGWSEASDIGTLAGQNSWFDATFLRAAADRYSVRWPFGYRQVDLHSVLFATLLRQGIDIPVEEGLDALSLSTAMRFVGLQYGEGRHSALTNARLAAEAFSRLIHGKALLKEFERYEIPPFLLRRRL
jgi:DNA polymerase III epsilon subunit-like protein